MRPAFFLLHQIIVDSIFRIQIGVYVHLAHIMEQVEVKIFHLAFLQLCFKDFFHLVHIGQVISREFGGEIE